MWKQAAKLTRFPERRPEWNDRAFHYDLRISVAARLVYIETLLLDDDPALPLLVKELRREPDHWFVALQAITGTNPIPASARGDIEKMTQAWLSWAEQHGL